MGTDLIQFLIGALVGGSIVAGLVLRAFWWMAKKTIDAEFALMELQQRHGDVVTAAQKLLDEVVQYRRIHAIWTARVVQRASKGEFTQTEIEL